jgi:glycosyltransferase involved in cell wall biosynthesis
MKILFFNYEFPPLGGGAGNASYYLLREYSKIPGVEVDFVTASIDSEYHLEKMGENIRIHRLPIGKNNENIHFQSQKDLLKYAWRGYLFSRKLAKNGGYDLTHSFFTVPCGFISMLLKWEFKLPYIVSLRGSDVPGYSERFTMLYKLINPIIFKIWKNAQFVIANSEGLRDLALKSQQQKEIGVILNGIDIGEFHPKNELRMADQFRILCVSRVTPRKGLRFLVQAMKILTGRYPHLRMVVAGDGNERESLQHLAMGLGLEDKIVFLGIVPHEKLPALYQEANAFILPSLNEGMSNTMLEAIASGLPIVATDTGGTKEMVQDGVNGLIVAMKDADDLAEKIERLILNSQECESMGIASRQRAEGLSWESVAKRYVEEYVETINLRKMKEGK